MRIVSGLSGHGRPGYEWASVSCGSATRATRWGSAPAGYSMLASRRRVAQFLQRWCGLSYPFLPVAPVAALDLGVEGPPLAPEHQHHPHDDDQVREADQALVGQVLAQTVGH